MLYRRALPRATQSLKVEIGGTGLAVAGAVAMVVESVFSPVEVDRRLAAQV
ncbi:hypothetical protein ACIOD2_23015 [Amycolatopsis sp. NPDC088138]|uniref:hypothetical protein n=1 Tax=Amycolatopsis sp. NPDC088138 TaxID=3363938 RepID=UPI0038048D29